MKSTSSVPLSSNAHVIKGVIKNLIIYLDAIWFLNFLFDCLLLFLTAAFLKKKVKMYKIFIAATIGASYLLMAIGNQSVYFSHPLTKVTISLIMIFIVFGFHKMSIFLKHIFVFYLATFLIGGSITALHFLFSFTGLEQVNQYGDPISWLFILFATPFAFITSKKTVREITYSNIQTDLLYDVCIQLNELTFELRGLIDSGNSLRDPISREPVMIVQLSSVKKQLPHTMIDVLEQNTYQSDLSSLPESWTRLMRLIPVKVLGVNHQLLYAFKAQSIQINDDESSGLIIFTNQQLSNESTFNCIIHPQMIVDRKVLSVS